MSGSYIQEVGDIIYFCQITFRIAVLPLVKRIRMNTKKINQIFLSLVLFFKKIKDPD